MAQANIEQRLEEAERDRVEPVGIEQPKAEGTNSLVPKASQHRRAVGY